MDKKKIKDVEKKKKVKKERGIKQGKEGKGERKKVNGNIGWKERHCFIPQHHANIVVNLQ